MKTALFDIFSGIAGDMTIAALVDAGADLNYLKSELNKLGISGYEIAVSEKTRNHIAAQKFDVMIHHKPHLHTQLADIFKLIDDSSLSEFVKINSKRIFEAIGTAEAKIHNIPIEKIHFHEVGAIDSIVDIVGACICLENLGIQKVYTTPVRLGRGMIKTQHGVMPNPAPATLEIIKGYPVEFTDIDFELTTPTGAAIVKTLSSGIYGKDLPARIKTEKTGFGSGTFDIPELPNLLRVIIADIEEPVEQEPLLQIETNIDDLNPQVYPYLMEKLFEAGVNDVYYQQIVMKKGRPGILLSVLLEEHLLNDVLKIIYSETTTLGVRISEIGRHKLKREIIEKQTSLGIVKIKAIKSTNGNIKYYPEFEECKRLAKKYNKPLMEIQKHLLNELNL
jgi:hypothetical protein